MSQGQNVDYDSLAKSAGGSTTIDQYDSIAAQHGGRAVGMLPEGTFKAAPKPWTVPWLKEKLYNIADSLTEAMPAAGATGGAIIGGTAGSPTGPGAALSAIGGAGIGGMAGEALKQHVRRALGMEAPTTGEEAANDITKQGLLQGGTQAVSEVLPIAAAPLKKAALGQYERALAPTTKVNKAITAKIAPQMIDRGVSGSLGSIENQAASKATDLRPQIDQAIEAIPDSELNAFLEKYNIPAVKGGTTQEVRDALAAKRAQSQLGSMASTVPSRTLGEPNQIVDSIGSQASTIPESVFGSKQGTRMVIDRNAGPTSGAGKKIVDDLESLRQSYMVDGKIADPQAVNAIEGVQNIVKQYGDDISAKSLRRLRQIFDNPVAKAGGYNGADLSTAYALQAKEQAANSIRDILSEASPDVARLNKEMNFWLNVQQVAKESGLRRTGQEGGLGKVLAPIGAGLGFATGHAVGGPTAGLEGAIGVAGATALGQAMRSPWWRTSSAVMKDRLANALANGSAGETFAVLTRMIAAGQLAASHPQSPQPNQ